MSHLKRDHAVDLLQQVSRDGEREGDGEGRVDGRYGRLGPAKSSRAQGTAIALDCASQRDWQKQHEERVQADGLCDVAAQQSGKSARGAASGTVDVQVQADGADGIEGSSRWGIEQQHSAREEGCREQQIRESPAPGQRQIAAPRDRAIRLSSLMRLRWYWK